jgi:hypothetical protein
MNGYKRLLIKRPTLLEKKTLGRTPDGVDRCQPRATIRIIPDSFDSWWKSSRGGVSRGGSVRPSATPQSSGSVQSQYLLVILDRIRRRITPRIGGADHAFSSAERRPAPRAGHAVARLPPATPGPPTTPRGIGCVVPGVAGSCRSRDGVPHSALRRWKRRLWSRRTAVLSQQARCRASASSRLSRRPDPTSDASEGPFRPTVKTTRITPQREGLGDVPRCNRGKTSIDQAAAVRSSGCHPSNRPACESLDQARRTSSPRSASLHRSS